MLASKDHEEDEGSEGKDNKDIQLVTIDCWTALTYTSQLPVNSSELPGDYILAASWNSVLGYRLVSPQSTSVTAIYFTAMGLNLKQVHHFC